LLPLPVPLSNFFPALTIVLLAAGSLENDGIFFLAGAAMFVLAIAYLVGVVVLGTQVVLLFG
jgi:hypothetical protein